MRDSSRAGLRPARLIPCAVVLLAVGCRDAPNGSQERVPEWSLDALVRIQPEATPGQPPFGRIADLEIGADGSVFVLDGLSRTVRVFDRAGSELRAFGGRGQGPGELEEPLALLWGPEGKLWVLDVGNGRLTVFEPTGEALATFTPSDLPVVFPLALGFAGRDTLRLVGVTSPDPSDPRAAWFETRIAGGTVRPVARRELPFVEWPLLYEHRTEEIAIVVPVPYSGTPLFGFDPTGRLYYAHSGHPRLYRWSAEDDIELTFGRDLEPVPVTSGDVETATAAPDFEELRVTGGQAAVAELGDMVPDVKPYLAGFFFDERGNVWVVEGRSAPGTGQRTVDVYDAEGARVATARAALAGEPRPRVRGGLLAGVVRDTLDVESVVLYRIAR